MGERPRLYVLAGVNGAGKSSIGGQHLEDLGVSAADWFNPDRAARELVAAGVDPVHASAQAWSAGRDLLRHAIEHALPHAFETTLGGTTIPRLILEATRTHRVHVWFCGLDTPEHHIRRVRERVARGGHDIPEAKIRQRWLSARANLIGLMPRLAGLQVYDNSIDAGADGVIPDPRLLLHVQGGRMRHPATLAQLRATPEWAMAIVEAAIELDAR